MASLPFCWFLTLDFPFCWFLTLDFLTLRFLSMHQALLERGLWVKAENVGICLFCSLTAFLGDEVYLLNDRASGRWWCRVVSCRPPPNPLNQHPDFHTLPLGSAAHQLVYKYTSTLTHVSQALLFLVATWKVRNISRWIYQALWPSQCL